MTKDTFKYKCSDVIDPETKEYRKKCSLCAINMYLSEQGLKHVEKEGDHFCPHTNKKLELISVKTELAVPVMGVKMSINEIKKDRSKISTNDFKKNIFPKFEKGTTEHRFFKNKHKDLS